MAYTKETLTQEYGGFWPSYRHLKAQYQGFKLRHPSWAGIIDAFVNPPPQPAPDLSWLLTAQFTPELLHELASGKHGAIAALLVDAGFKYAQSYTAFMFRDLLNEPIQPQTGTTLAAA